MRRTGGNRPGISSSLSEASAIKAFGFSLTDFGDFGGFFDLNVYSQNNLIHTIQVSRPTNAGDGSLAFVGFLDDTGQTYDKLEFVINQCDSIPLPTRCNGISGEGTDILGFDDMFFGTLLADDNGNGSNPAPEPGTLALLGASLLGLAAARRRRA